MRIWIDFNSHSIFKGEEIIYFVLINCVFFGFKLIFHRSGVASFPGRVLHAHDFRSADEFAGKDVLLIGASYSAEDIGSQLLKYGAKSISYSFRTKPMRFKWPEGVQTFPLVEKIEGKTVHFKSGTQKDFDSIILCTGYLHSYPFLEDSLRLKSANRLYPPHLYKGIFLINDPRIMYIGAQDQYFTFNMFDTQAWYARDVMLRLAKLPPKSEMEADSKAWLAREEKISHYNEAIDFQADYVQDLLELSDCPRWDVAEVARMFKVWEQHKTDDIMTFRNKGGFKSVVTGHVSPDLKRSWMETLDDSKENYLKMF